MTRHSIRRDLDGGFSLPLTKTLAQKHGPFAVFEIVDKGDRIIALRVDAHRPKKRGRKPLQIDTAKVIDLYRSGKKIREVADEFSVSYATIRNILAQKKEPRRDDRSGGNRRGKGLLKQHLPEIKAMYLEEDKTLEEIGKRFGVTREAIRQFLRNEGLIKPHRVRSRFEDYYQSHKQQAAEAIIEHGSVTAARHKTDFSLSVLQRAHDEVLSEAQRKQLAINYREKMLAIRADVQPKVSDEQLLTWLRQAAEELGQPLGPIEYDRLARKRGWNTSQTFELHFGRFRDACQLIGVESKTPLLRRLDSYKRVSEEDCRKAVWQVAFAMGRIPSYEEYEAHSRGTRPRGESAFGLGLPSGSTVRKRLGGKWGNVVRYLQEEGFKFGRTEDR